MVERHNKSNDCTRLKDFVIGMHDIEVFKFYNDSRNWRRYTTVQLRKGESVSLLVNARIAKQIKILVNSSP